MAARQEIGHVAVPRWSPGSGGGRSGRLLSGAHGVVDGARPADRVRPRSSGLAGAAGFPGDGGQRAGLLGPARLEVGPLVPGGRRVGLAVHAV